MARLIFDIEANGLLDTVTKIHCLALMEEDGTNVQVFGGHTDEQIRNVLSHLEDAPCLIGHNIIEYDIRALQKVYPAFKPRGQKIDTLICSQLIWTDLRNQDFQFQRKHPDFPGKLIGRHSLESWGYRLGEFKGKVKDTEDGDAWYAQWSQELQDYCVQDIRVNQKFWNLIKSKDFSQQAIELEMEFKEYALAQEEEGLPFDVEAAKSLYAELAAERAKLEADLKQYFPPFEVVTKFTPKRNNAKKGYVAGVVFDKKKLVEFNPRSHKQVASRLIAQRGWKPEDFTDTGEPCTDSEVLESLAKEWPECGLLAKHAEIQKIIGMVAEGKQAYLKCEKSGRIHGRLKTCGTVTGRCAHSDPNLGNIPRRGELGKRVRALFRAPDGFSFVGTDAKGLEIRMLAHFLAKFDGGEYAKIAVEGDPHAYHQEMAGLGNRDQSKTFFYGWLYGAGDAKIGLIIGKGASAGKRLRFMFLKKFKALGALKDQVTAVATQRGHLIGLDGRRLHVRAVYSALNTLLQSAGAVLVKVWTVLFNRELRRRGLFQAGHARMVVHVHDEFQVLVRNGYEQEVEQIALDTIIQAGELLGLRVKTEGDAKHGATWADTH